MLVGLANWLMAISLIFLCKGIINSLTPRRSIGGAFRGGSSGPMGSLPDIAILEALGVRHLSYYGCHDLPDGEVVFLELTDRG